MDWLIFFTRYAGWSFFVLLLTAFSIDIVNMKPILVLFPAITILLFSVFLFRKQDNPDNQNTKRYIWVRLSERIFLGIYLLLLIVFLLIDLVLNENYTFPLMSWFSLSFVLFFIAYHLVLLYYLIFSVFCTDRSFLFKCADVISCILLCVSATIIVSAGYGINLLRIEIPIVYESLFVFIGHTHPYVLLCLFYTIIACVGNGIELLFMAIPIAYGSLFLMIGYTHSLYQKKQTSEESSIMV